MLKWVGAKQNVIWGRNIRTSQEVPIHKNCNMSWMCYCFKKSWTIVWTLNILAGDLLNCWHPRTSNSYFVHLSSKSTKVYQFWLYELIRPATKSYLLRAGNVIWERGIKDKAKQPKKNWTRLSITLKEHLHCSLASLRDFLGMCSTSCLKHLFLHFSTEETLISDRSLDIYTKQLA